MLGIQHLNRHGMDLVLTFKKKFMKTLFQLRMKRLNQLRKRLAHLAIGPLVGALIAGLLLLVLMLHVANGPGPGVQGNGDSHGLIRSEVSSTVSTDPTS